MHVVSLRSPIIQINNLKKGETAGYSRTFKAKKNQAIYFRSDLFHKVAPVTKGVRYSLVKLSLIHI